MSEQNNTNQTPEKKIKKKGPIRTEAVVPFIIVCVVVGAYFKFFFDLHLKSAIEFIGYQVVGAEVDVRSLETSFIRGTFRMQGIEITDAEKPTHNSIEIGDIRFGVLWDGLLRARFVVEEMATEQIMIGTQRKKPGKVKPPEPPPSKSAEPSMLEKEAGKIKDKALKKAQSQYSDNVIGDAAAMLSGNSAQDQMGAIEAQLPSKAKLKEFEAAFQAKQKGWQQRLQSLPQAKEIQSLGDRLSKVKVKDFKSPQELQQSLQEIDSVIKDADAKYKLVQSTGNDLSSDLKTMDQELKSIDALVKKDINDLESRFRLPKIDAKSFSQSIFYQYMSPYIQKFYHYKGLADKYVPPNLMKKKDPNEVDTQIQPRPRAKGVVYEFGRQNSYPAFWIKKISVSSKAGVTPESGDVKGLITDITSNQALIGRPTVVQVQGDFPAMNFRDIFFKMFIDNTKASSKIGFDFKIGSYPLEGKELVSSPDAHIAFKKATASLATQGQLIALRDFSLSIDNKFTQMDYDVSSKNEVVDGILKEVFKDLPAINVSGTGQGELPDIDLSLDSNLGPELQKGFEKQLQKKIDEARAKLQAFIDQNIGKEKAKIEADYNKLKNQIEGEVKKVQDQLNSEKSKGDAKVNQAKKDSEDQAKRKLEEEAKKAVGGDKKLEDLKKKFGF